MTYFHTQLRNNRKLIADWLFAFELATKHAGAGKTQIFFHENCKIPPKLLQSLCFAVMELHIFWQRWLLMMSDYLITGGMRTLYLPFVNTPVALGQADITSGKRIPLRRRLMLPAYSEAALSGAERRCSQPRAQDFNVIFHMMTKVCLPCVTYCVKDTVYLFHITAPPCSSFTIRLQ